MKTRKQPTVYSPTGGAIVLRYQIATTVGACANFLAVLALLHVVGGIYQGHGEWEPLIAGSGALVLGLLLCLLGDIGKRLVRIEQQAAGNHNSSRENEDVL